MVYRRLFALWVVLSYVFVAESVKLWDCGSFVEDIESPIVYCFADYLPSIVNWTLVNEAGATRYLGSCYGYDNCSSDFNSSALTLNSLDHRPNYNIQFPQILREFSGTLMCQGTLANGTVISDTCELKLVRVKITSVDVPDGDSGYVECTNYPYAPSTVTWTLTTDSGQPLDLGTCTDVIGCSSPHFPGINLTRPSNDSSRVDFANVNRTLHGQLSCSIAYTGLRFTDTRTLNVYHPATVDNCSVDISRHNWSAILSCDITDVFSSAGVYNFQLTQIFLIGFSFHDEYVFGGRRSYRDGLTSHVNDTDNQVYYSGTLTYSWHLLALTRQSTGFYVYVQDGDSIAGFALINKIVNVNEPGEPTHNCVDQMYFPQTGVLPCVCTIDSLGSPEGRLVWLLDNIAMATGDYGVTQLTFPSGDVSSEHDGTMATCQLDWVQPMAAVNTSHVTYRENFNRDINMTLKYELQTNCTRVIETREEIRVHAGIIRQNQEWPGLCTDSNCINAFVSATCDSEVITIITTIVVILQVPETVRSNETQSTSSLLDVVLGALNLETIKAILKDIKVSYPITCTNGYIPTETNCVKPEEPSSTVKPSSVSPALMGSIIGGVVAFLVVVILIVLVILVNRRLNRLKTDRRPSTVRTRQDDEHDYTSLTPAGSNAGPDRSGQQERVELGLQDLDLTNPSEQNERPVSDYDVIGEENPEIANIINDSNNTTEVSDNDYLTLLPPLENGNGEGGDNPADYLTPISLDESSKDKNDEDYLTPISPEESSEDKNDEDYITPISPDESSEDKNDEDYLTPISPDESSEDKNDEDYLTPISPDESSEDKNDEDYITPISPDESSEDKNDEDYITPCSPDESSEDKNDEDYITPISPDESNEDKNDEDYITPCSPDESSEDKDDEDYITPISPDESSEDKDDEDYITPM